jgi:hypothetical protein
MALVTYTLLAAFASGHPEVLASSLSKSFAVVVFEFLCIRYVDAFFLNGGRRLLTSRLIRVAHYVCLDGIGLDVTSWMCEDLVRVELN